MKMLIESTKRITQKTLIQRACQHAVIILSIAISSSFSQVTYSDGWTERKGAGPWGDLLHTSTTANATATIKDTGTEAFVIYRTGTQNGIFQVVVDGDPATTKEIDTYSPAELWNKKTVVASNLTNGPHTIVVTVTGKKNASASAASVQIVDKWTLGRGMWSPEKAWAWYKNKPWIVGWNYTPTTCVNATEWWQDEKKVSDSTIHRELKLGQQLGYNSVIVYLQYLVWLKDSAYCKERFNKFLALADQHNMTVTPTFFDDVNFVCSGDDCGNSHLGDQGEPDAGKLMSQWGASPGPKYVLDANQRPNFKRYVQDFIRTFGQDKRILMWNVYNEPSNSGIGSRTYPLVELTFVWAREVGCSQPLTVSDWTNQSNAWPYNLSDICSFHGYTNNAGLVNLINKLRATQRPIMCTEWLARGNPGTNILTDLPMLKRLGVGAIQWSLVNGRMHCERSWSNFGSYNNPWFHDVLYNDGKPYKADEVFAIYKNLSHKTINWAPGKTDGSITVKRGCTDPRYSQYDSMATEDDGSCKTLLAQNIPGCMDKNSKNYCPFATQNDPAMCNAVDVVVPPQVAMQKHSLLEMYSFIGQNRIQILEHSATRVELFNTIGQMVWNQTVEGPCIIDISTSLRSGVYCARFSTRTGNVAVIPMFRLQ